MTDEHKARDLYQEWHSAPVNLMPIVVRGEVFDSVCALADALEAAQAEIERLREALRGAARDMTCGERDDAHYCPNCDRTTYKPREAIRRALLGDTHERS